MTVDASYPSALGFRPLLIVSPVRKPSRVQRVVYWPRLPQPAHRLTTQRKSQRCRTGVGLVSLHPSWSLSGASPGNHHHRRSSADRPSVGSTHWHCSGGLLSHSPSQARPLHHRSANANPRTTRSGRLGPDRGAAAPINCRQARRFAPVNGISNRGIVRETQGSGSESGRPVFSARQGSRVSMASPAEFATAPPTTWKTPRYL